VRFVYKRHINVAKIQWMTWSFARDSTVD